MVRLQVLLSEEQATRLRQAAAVRRVPVAQLVREALDDKLGQGVTPVTDEARQRFLAALGTFRLNAPDAAQNHDKYLAEAYDHPGTDEAPGPCRSAQGRGNRSEGTGER